MDYSMETWKPVPGWETRYEVSDTGVVRSRTVFVRAGKGGAGLAIRRGRELQPVVKSGRYLCVTLADGERREQGFVHDVVAAAFIGPKPEGQETRHLDDNKANNATANLAYGTKLENEADRQRNQRVPQGERHGCARLTESAVRAIRASTATPSVEAAHHGVTPAHIHAIRTRRVWRHI